MSRPSGFYFYDDPSAPTPATEHLATIDWGAQTVSWVGATSTPFECLAAIRKSVRRVLNQDLSDFETEDGGKIYRPSTGALLMTVKATTVSSAPGVPPTITTVSPGTSAMVPGAALDLVNAFSLYGLIPPEPVGPPAP